MALQHLRSSTASKRPQPAGMSDGQLAINTNTASPGLFFKDSAGALIKVGPVHVGTTAPNASPASGGQTGNTVGEQWLDTTGGGYVFKVWDGSAWRSETGEFVNVNGDTMTGDLVMNNANIVFEGATADNFETTLTVTDPTADRTITLPDVSGTVVTTGDTGSVTSTMIADGTIVDADINASAEIAVSKLADGTARQLLQTDAAGTGVEWTSNIDIPGTLDVTGAATFDSTVTIGGSAALVASAIGTTVQAYDADTAKLDVIQTFTAVQTLTDPAIIGTILEDVYTISDGAAFEVDPGNGSVQLITLGANRTPKATNFAAGESITLMVDDGTAYTLTWTDATWGTGGVKWTSGTGKTAPTLATSGYTVIQFWKVGSQVYGAYVGDVG